MLVGRDANFFIVTSIIVVGSLSVMMNIGAGPPNTSFRADLCMKWTSWCIYLTNSELFKRALTWGSQFIAVLWHFFSLYFLYVLMVSWGRLKLVGSWVYNWICLRVYLSLAHHWFSSYHWFLKWSSLPCLQTTRGVSLLRFGMLTPLRSAGQQSSMACWYRYTSVPDQFSTSCIGIAGRLCSWL